ncbi:MAG: NnrS family protein [Halocynthiibacter sp.]
MSAIKRLFSEGYRAFFFFSAAYAVVTGGVWAYWLWGGDLPFFERAILPQWHAHEMIFGFATAAMAGFFLTAVPNWVGGAAARPFYIAMVALIWALGRIAMWYSGALPAGIVMVLDLMFLPLLGLNILLQLLKRPKPQNMVFLLFMTLIWVANLMVHLEWVGITDDTLSRGLRGGLFGFCAMIGILGGRVTPAFTRNAMKRAGVDEAQWPTSNPWIEKLSLVSSIGLPIVVLVALPDLVIGAWAIGFACLQALRLRNWRGAWCLRHPILWALHMSIGMNVIGAALWGSALMGVGSERAALHILGIGAAGGMILAIMSRASLGHSGRALIAPKPVSFGYWAIAGATLIRFVAENMSGGVYTAHMIAAVLLWMIGFGAFLWALWPALFCPRVDRG